MIRHRKSLAGLIAITAAVSTSTARAADLFWLGGTGAVDSANYVNSSTHLTVDPKTAGDYSYIGEDGVTTYSATGTVVISRLTVGHNFATGTVDGALPGPGTLTVSKGTLTFDSGTTSTGQVTPGSDGGLTVGYNNTGTVNITGGTLRVNRNASIGLDNTDPADLVSNAPGATASLNISGTGTFQMYGASAGVIYVGNGVPGSITISDSGTLKTTTGSVQVGVNSTGTFTQTGGTTTLSGGFMVATGASNNSFATLSGNTVFTAGGNLVVADANSTATNASLSISDNAKVTVGNSVFLGRASSVNAAINISGGQFIVTNHFLMGTGANPTGVVVNQTGGSVTTLTTSTTNTANPPVTTIYNFAINDTGTGNCTYNLSGGTLTTVARGLVGRQNGTGTMNQSGGTANFNNSLHVGDSQGTSAAVYGNGFYNLSAGALVATVPSGSTVEAFSVAPAGNGTFRVIGGDASVNVTGNMGVYANTNSGTNTGKLIYQPEPGEALTTINVTGTATFKTGSLLQLDLSLTKPTRGLFTVLNAGDIVNNGTVLLPGGWNYSVTAGGLGKQLKLFAGDFNADGRIDGDDYAWMDRGAAKHLTDGANGDLNADGTINSQDYLLIDSAYAQLGNPLSPGFLAARETQFGSDYVAALVASVPEPTSLTVCGLAGLLPLARRRRAK